MSTTVEQVRAFITDAKRARNEWLPSARDSWDEVNKSYRNKRGGLSLAANDRSPNARRRKTRYPAWWSIFKIRQPLVFSRQGVPIGRDTTQAGTDNIGACAAICKERLAINLAKAFDFYDVMSGARDDLLVTNVGFVRAYYESKDVKEQVKIRLTPQQDELGNITYLDEQGNIVTDQDIEEDDLGYYLETSRVIDVTEEKICLEHVLYNRILVDPSIRRWQRCHQIAIEEHYTEQEFAYIFGKKALVALPKSDQTGDNKGPPPPILVYEYWNEYTKETLYLPENGTDFVIPIDLPEEEEDEARNGIYDLAGFFPMAKPLIMNQSTDRFWPVPEYYQLQDLLNEIHTIFSKITQLTKAIRARILYDSNVDGVAQALDEFAEGDALGIKNLTQALVGANGSLENVVQYIPVEKLINSIDQAYAALEQRLNTLYKLTGTSDLLQGLITDPQQRTFGERQMTEKYALNQIEPPQRAMAEFVADNYELLCEMALKNFKDESLAKYIMPETLEPEFQAQYPQALELLKSENKRFRIELETDSTIALNEQLDKQERQELFNTLTTGIERVANIAETMPELVGINLHGLKYVIQGLRQAKMFQQEMVQTIDSVIEKTSQPQPPGINMDEENLKLQQQQLQLKAQELQGSQKLEEYKILSDERLATATLQQEERFKTIDSQLQSVLAQNSTMLAQMKVQVDTVTAQATQEDNRVQAQIAYEKMQSDIALAQEDLQAKREELAIKLQSVVNKQEVDQMLVMLEAKVATETARLNDAYLEIDRQKTILDEREKYATEQRLQAEHQLRQLEVAMQARSEQTSVQPIVIPPKKTKRKVKVVRSPEGELQNFEIQKETEE